MKIHHFLLLSAILVSLSMLLYGCAPQESAHEKTMQVPAHNETPTTPRPETQTHTDPPEPTDAPTPDTAFQVLESAGFLCYADKMYVGTETRKISQSADGLQIRDTSALNLNRYGNSVSASVTHEETLKPTGEQVKFHTEVSMGGSPILYAGELPQESIAAQPSLSLTVSSQGMTQKQELVFPKVSPKVSPQATHQTSPKSAEIKLLGAFGLETSLLQTPIRLGETRELVRLNPTMLRWEFVTLHCAELERIPLLDGQSFPFYRVELSSRLYETDGTLSKTQFQKETLWCDGKGLIWKRWSPLMELSAWRVSASAFAEYQKSKRFPSLPTQTAAAAALGTDTGTADQTAAEIAGSADFANTLNVPLQFAKELTGETASSFSSKAAHAHEIVYLVTAKSSETGTRPALSGLFESTDLQKVETLDPFTLRITVRSSGPAPNAPAAQNSETVPQLNENDGSKPVETKPTEEDRSANSMIQSSAPEIRVLAFSVLPEETDPLKLGLALEKRVWSFIQNKNYARGFVTALEVVQDPSGDCTEHAVLLAALARARNIPARIAQGLIFEPRSGKMAWHVWNELYINEMWIPLDATIGQNHVNALHLRINSGSFSNATLPQTLLPAAQLIGKLQITAEAVR